MESSNKLILLTGSSKGLGNALLAKYLSEGDHVFHISRSKHESNEANQFHQQHSVTDWEQLAQTLIEFREYAAKHSFSEIVLINNAGILGTANSLDKVPVSDIANTINVNLTSPMVLISLFVKEFKESNYALSIVNISSGAAHSAIHGWAAYSASKAGMDMMTKTVSLELESREAPTRVYSIYPGVIDTGMQAQIRSTEPADFPSRQKFIDLKVDGNLSSSEEVAKKIHYLAHTLRPISGSIVDIREIET
jgi:benzil reductase ((S)-benzoin forming)